MFALAESARIRLRCIAVFAAWLVLPLCANAQQGQASKPSLAVDLTGPAHGLVDRPMTFTVLVCNHGSPTDKDLCLFVLSGPLAGNENWNGQADDVVIDLPLEELDVTEVKPPNAIPAPPTISVNCLHVGRLNEMESRTLTFKASGKRAAELRLAVFQGAWNPGLLNFNISQVSVKPEMKVLSNRAIAHIVVDYDPQSALENLLPTAPPAASRPAKLPESLADVPEVHFQGPLTADLGVEQARLHNLRVIDRINYLNRKKTDGFVEALISKRHDLAGLPFALGDACRLSEKRASQFVAALEVFRLAADVKRWEVKLERFEMDKGIVNPSVLVEVERLLKEARAAYMHSLSLLDPRADVAAHMQVEGPGGAETQLGLVARLGGLSHVDATRALAKAAIFSEEPEVRAQAIRQLKMRRDRDYSDILLTGLRYPWPAVAERSSEAIIQLGRTDLVPQLKDMLSLSDPRAAQVQHVAGKPVNVVREVVRINHLHNCLLCHAPAIAPANTPAEYAEHFQSLTAQVPVPGESPSEYYRPAVPDLLIRFDVTYLRQDFSLMLPADPGRFGPKIQRYDFLVRTRTVSDEEARSLAELLRATDPREPSPYRRAAQTALGLLDGRDAPPAAGASDR